MPGKKTEKKPAIELNEQDLGEVNGGLEIEQTANYGGAKKTGKTRPGGLPFKGTDEELQG